MAEGARSVEGTEVVIKRVPELMPEEVARRVGAKLDQAAPVAAIEELSDYDAIIFGTPTRFGNMCAQMRNFVDQTGKLWLSGGLVGKVTSVFTSTATQHGGQETTITSFHSTLLHHGMIIAIHARLLNMDEISGGSPPMARERLRVTMAAASPRKTSWRSHGFKAGMLRRLPGSSARNYFPVEQGGSGIRSVRPKTRA